MYRAKRSGTGMIELAPEQILALAFCRRRLREPYGLLLRFDRSLGRAMPHLGPPIVGQARLAWWREQIRSSPGSGAPDPVLDGLGGMIGTHPAARAGLAALVDGWEALVADSRAIACSNSRRRAAEACFVSRASYRGAKLGSRPTEPERFGRLSISRVIAAIATWQRMPWRLPGRSAARPVNSHARSGRLPSLPILPTATRLAALNGCPVQDRHAALLKPGSFLSDWPDTASESPASRVSG